jgi:thiosulfate dehydrogenase
MRGEPLSFDAPSGLALLAYLRSLSAAPDAARPLTFVRSIDPTYIAQLPPGDGSRGESLYHDACGYCHGDPHSGKGRLGTRVSILPEATLEVFGGMARSIMIEKIRHGKFFHIGGNMPPYGAEMLSDTEVADIVEYLLTR